MQRKTLGNEIIMLSGEGFLVGVSRVLSEIG